MDTQSIHPAITRFLVNLSPIIKPQKVLVFGSRVKNTQKKESDIDCLVVSSSFATMTEDERLDILYKASRFIDPEIHPWGVTPQELIDADKQSMIGYARDTGITI